jgi:hypothetical protein
MLSLSPHGPVDTDQIHPPLPANRQSKGLDHPQVGMVPTRVHVCVCICVCERERRFTDSGYMHWNHGVDIDSGSRVNEGRPEYLDAQDCDSWEQDEEHIQHSSADGVFRGWVRESGVPRCEVSGHGAYRHDWHDICAGRKEKGQRVRARFVCGRAADPALASSLSQLMMMTMMAAAHSYK